MKTKLNLLVPANWSWGRASRQKIAVGKRPFPCFFGKNVERLLQQFNLHPQNAPFRLLQMRRGIVIAVILLMTLGVASPVFACLPPQREMTAVAHGCCKPVASSCSSDKTPSSQACCDKETPNGNSSIVATANESAPVCQFITTSDVDIQANEFASCVAGIDHPPNNSVPNSSILRI